MPELARQSSELLQESTTNWNDSQTPAVGHSIGKFKHLMQRVEADKIRAMVEASAAPAEKATKAPSEDDDSALQAEPLAEQCSIDDFAKIDLRVARVVAAESVPKAKKLLKLTLSLGGDNQRTVFAGIKAAYEPEKLVGRLVVMVANLAPREMKFGTSEGMVIASGPGGEDVFLLSVDSGAKPGQRVH